MNIAVLGGGIEGRSIIQYFSKKGAKITLCDRRALDLESLDINRRFLKETHFGEDYLADLEQFDLVFRSPGIPFLTAQIQQAIQRGANITSLTKYFFEKCPAKIIGITGTKGKGTTATLLYEILKKAGFPVFLGGNIGKPPLDFLDNLTASDWVILELSSFQLQDLHQSPSIAIVLPITEDHLDHHKALEEYVEAKKNIIRFQKKDDLAVIALDAEGYQPNFAVTFLDDLRAENLLKISLRDKPKIRDLKSPLLGDYNRLNVLVAAHTALALDVPEGIIRDVVANFHGLPHRLEFVGEINGVKFYNDSASTNPDTALAAIRSFDTPLILIAGGSEKKASYARLAEEIVRRVNVKTVVLMGETSPRIEKAIDDMSEKLDHEIEGLRQRGREVPLRTAPLEVIKAENYQEAFMASKLLAKTGDTVLLSPASASFDMFENYMERGESFKAFVKSLR